jgi:hypothetical protein
MEIDDKGGEIVQRSESFRRDWDLDMDKEGATLKIEMDQNSWTREAHE